jgi:hypothetical protein
VESRVRQRWYTKPCSGIQWEQGRTLMCPIGDKDAVNNLINPKKTVHTGPCQIRNLRINSEIFRVFWDQLLQPFVNILLKIFLKIYLTHHS